MNRRGFMERLAALAAALSVAPQRLVPDAAPPPVPLPPVKMPEVTAASDIDAEVLLQIDEVECPVFDYAWTFIREPLFMGSRGNEYTGMTVRLEVETICPVEVLGRKGARLIHMTTYTVGDKEITAQAYVTEVLTRQPWDQPDRHRVCFEVDGVPVITEKDDG